MAIKTNEQMRQAIRDFGGDEGWWHKSGEDTFNRLAGWLVNRGFTPQEAVNFLAEAYDAVGRPVRRLSRGRSTSRESRAAGRPR